VRNSHYVRTIARFSTYKYGVVASRERDAAKLVGKWWDTDKALLMPGNNNINNNNNNQQRLA
jgi:hypothetical protein